MLPSNFDHIKSAIIETIRKYPITQASLFGSILRPDFSPRSDIDLLVNFDKKVKLSLLDVAHITNDLETKLNRKIDLVQYNNIKPELKNYILPTQQIIYENSSL